MNALNLQSSVKITGQFELLLKDREHHICAYGEPCLGLRHVGARAVVTLDSQQGFDPAEEQPAAQSCGPIDRHRVVPLEIKIAFRADEKESSGLSNKRQTREVHVDAIYEINSTCYEREAV